MQHVYPYEPDWSQCELARFTDESTCYVMNPCLCTPAKEHRGKIEQLLLRLLRQTALSEDVSR